MTYGTRDHKEWAAVKDVTASNTGPNGLLTAKAAVVGILGADGLTVAGSSNGLPISPSPSTTGATTSVASSATPVTLLAANTARRGATIVNDSTAILYGLLGAGTVSATNYTFALDGKSTVPGYYEAPFGFTGIITGIWASATGSARVTEFS